MTTTGWPPSTLMQDDCRGLSVWLSKTPHARRLAEEAAAAIVRDHKTGEAHLVPVIAVDFLKNETNGDSHGATC